MGILRFFDGSTPNASKPPFWGQQTESNKMDITRMISLAGLTMIFFWIYLSIRRNRNLPKRHAAERLFEAFKDEIQGLSSGKRDAYEILKQAFPRHESAYLHFRPHLNGKVLQKFDEAWREYTCGVEDQSPSFPKENSAPGKEALLEESRKLALRKILALLSLARKYSHLPPR
jgi:hypothetical protein